MKKIIILFLTLSLCLCFCACDNDSDSDERDVSVDDTVNSEQGLTRSEVEGLVPYYLLEQLEKEIRIESVDLKQTRYSIGTIEEDEDGDMEAYGTFTLYEKTGRLYNTGTFHMKVGEYGMPFKCAISLD